MKRNGILAVACIALLTIGCRGEVRDTARPAGEAPAVGTSGEANRDVPMRARNWVEDRLKDGMTEVKLGELASEKALNPDVKAFGRQMVTDHTAAGTELKQLVSKHNITPPAELDGDRQDKVERLSKLQGAEFDREYMNTMVDDHEKTKAALEDRLDKEGSDDNPTYRPKQNDNVFESELNQYSSKVIPTVREHLAKAKQLDEKLGRRTTNDR